MKRRFWLPLGCGLLVQLASCNTFDEPGGDEVPPIDGGFGPFAGPGFGAPPSFDGGVSVSSPGFGGAGRGIAGFGAAGFGAAGMWAAGSGGRGGWQLLDGGVPPLDDGGEDDAGR